MSKNEPRERKHNFIDSMRCLQIEWRKNYLSNQEYGRQNGGYHRHVLPADEWERNLWSEINDQSEHSLQDYIEENKIRRHTGCHNLLSSWILCANLYFPFRCEPGYEMLVGFLRHYISSDIQIISGVELEYEPQEAFLKPSALLGEMDGGRGAGQTSPDVAFLVETKKGLGIILVECKFTEHNFYPCSGRDTDPRNGIPNRELSRCLNISAILEDPPGKCHLYMWKRKYWDHLANVANRQELSQLKACPAANGGYQLFRRRSLAEGIAQSGRFALVVSAVAYDERNTGLMRSMNRSTGISDICEKWGTLFPGKARFTTFTHQAWVGWVRKHDQQGLWKDWLEYINKRYSM